MFVLRRVSVRIKATINLRSLSLTRLNSTDRLQKYDVVFGTNEDFTGLRKEETKSLRIAILGAPNTGKSTLINELVNHQVCAASSKKHTTRVACRAITHINDTELVFIDTPGVVLTNEMNKLSLEQSFKVDPKASLKQADMVGVLHDISEVRTREKIHPEIIGLINSLGTEIPTLLLLNKVDKIKKKQVLLDLVNKLTGEKGWPNFVDVFMLSALNGDGVKDLRDYFVDSAKWREWDYEKEILTDQKPEDMIVRIVRANMLNVLPLEIPYNLNIKMEYFNICEDESVNSYVLIECPTERLYKLVLRKLKPQLRDMAQAIEQTLTRNFQRTVRLKLVIQPKQTSVVKNSLNKNK